jgi:hypothetical protein
VSFILDWLILRNISFQVEARKTHDEEQKGREGEKLMLETTRAN